MKASAKFRTTLPASLFRSDGSLTTLFDAAACDSICGFDHRSIFAAVRCHGQSADQVAIAEKSRMIMTRLDL
jgi:hypothetical protein